MAGGLTISTLNDSSGVLATQNGMSGIAKAWVYFTGSTGTINGSFNVSSVTRNATADYTINFTTAMPNASYCAVGNGGGDNYNTNGAGVINFNYNKSTGLAVAPTTSAIRAVVNFSGVDQPYTYVAIFR